MNKATRNRLIGLLGGVAGAGMTVAIFWLIRQRMVSTGESWHTVRLGAPGWAAGAIVLLAASLLLESRRWQILLRAARVPITRTEALRSVLGGIAASLLTPNRLGEYPARLVFIRQQGMLRGVGPALTGTLAQLVAMLVWGSIGLGIAAILDLHPQAGIAFVGASLLTLLVGLFYFQAGKWLPILFRHRRLRKLRIVGRSLAGLEPWVLRQALLLSLGRYVLYTTQLWLLLRWCGVPVDFPAGWALCLVFFWALALLPSIALAEAGIRGGLGVYLFASLYGHITGIVMATLLLWLLNLALPALVGTIFFVRAFKQSSSPTVKASS